MADDLQHLTKQVQECAGIPDGPDRDGVWGLGSARAVLKKFSDLGVKPTVADQPSRVGKIPQAAIDLILEAEGIDQPSEWPGESSGITIGFGYDLGYQDNFASDWKGILSDEAIRSLSSALGLQGERAAQVAARFRGINVTREQALKVFFNVTLPQEEAKTVKAFPGLDKMPDAVRGALVSLVFNRGTGMDGDRRREMRAIRELVASAGLGAIGLEGSLAGIAENLRSMKRLWVGKGVDGLITRRESEAALVESAIA